MTLYWSEAAADAIRRWVKKRGVAPGPLFTSRHKSRIGRTMLHYLMKRYCKEAGIPARRPTFILLSTRAAR